MSRLLSAGWSPILRVLLVAVAAQPAAAALIHDTTLRYPLVGGVLAAVEGAVLAYRSKTAPVTSSVPSALGIQMADLYRTAMNGGSAAVDHPAPTTPPGVPPTTGAS